MESKKASFTNSNEVHSAVIGIGKAFVGTEAHRRLLKYKAITMSGGKCAWTAEWWRGGGGGRGRTKDYDGNKQ